MSGKILIMGTGGCGSGFIWHMLRNCGLETTVHREWIRSGGIVRSKDPANFPAPKVIKHNGGFLKNLNKHLDNYQWDVEHIFFAVAKFDLAMDIYKERKIGMKQRLKGDEVVEDYYKKLGRGLVALAERDHPFTVVQCPRSILDVQYCYDKLKVVLPNATYEEFAGHHADLIIPARRDNLLQYAFRDSSTGRASGSDPEG